MDLTPEEKRKIYEEERARLEASALTPGQRRAVYEEEKARIEAAEENGLTEEDASPAAEEPARRNPWRAPAILAGVFVAIVWIVSVVRQPLHEYPKVAGTQFAADATLLAQSEDLVRLCTTNGVIAEVEYASDNTRVVMGPMFSSFPFKSKEGLCRAISYVSRSRGCPADFMLRDSMTNKHIGSFVLGMLRLE